MSKKAAQIPAAQTALLPRWLAVSIALGLVAAIGWLDFVTGPRTTFTLLYLLPVGVATWFIGRRAGFLTGAAAAVTALLVASHWAGSIAAEFWNTGVRAGVFLIFTTLLDHLHRQEQGRRVLVQAARLLGVSCAAAGLLAGVGWAVQKAWPRTAQVPLLDLIRPRHADLRSLATRIETALRVSRPILLGSRDPTGSSCVTPVKTGEIKDRLPATPYDLDGGPGTTMAALYTIGRENNTTAKRDLRWHQTRLKAWLENQATLNETAAAQAHELAEETRLLAEEVHGWSRIPDDVATSGCTRRDNWLGYCATEIDRALAGKDLARAGHWADELASACYALDDIHRWLSLAVDNQLAALAFQKRCQGLFEWADEKLPKYDPGQHVSAFPAGIACLNGLGNYTEIERQGERVFSMPADRIAEIEKNQHLTAGSLWVFPAARAAYERLRSVLSPPNQAVWDQAARTPYEHSYLVSMLYRARASDAIEPLAQALARFDATHPNANVAELMGVLMYRGHSFGGLEWSDRFQPELVAAAARIPPTDPDDAALMTAARFAYQICGGPPCYGTTFTLRNALAEHRLDCVRATDMIGAVFRNAGRPGFGHVRWCAGTAGHSVAAHFEAAGGAFRTVLADGLNPPEAPEVWPDCYFHGHAWPAGMQSNPAPYAVELYVRGLDTYLWAQGYIVRGPNAGWLVTANMPYSRGMLQASTKQIYPGPFPD